MPLTITHAKSNIIADWTGTVTVGNSSGGTNTVLATDLVRPQDWNSAHQYTLSLTASELTGILNIGTGLTSSTAAGGISIGHDLGNYYEPYILLNTNSTLIAYPAGTWYVDPIFLPFGLSKGRINVLMTYNSANFSHGVVGSAASTGQATKTASFINRFALYSQPSGANSTRIETLWTGEANLSATHSITFSSTATNDVRVTNAITYGFISQIDSTGGTTSTTTSTSGSALVAASTMASTVPNSLITGTSMIDYFTGSICWGVPCTATAPPGDYFLAHMHTISSGGGTTGGGNYLAGTCFNSSPGFMGILEPTITAYKRMGISTVGHSSTLPVPWHGLFATTTSTAPLGMATSDMRATTGRLYWNYIREPNT